MDFRKLARLVPDPSQGSKDNTTTPLPSLTDLPPNILEALIPGYSVISRYATLYLGLDVSFFVSLGIILFAFTKGAQYLYAQLERAFNFTLMSSVFIDEHDDLFDMLMAWLAAHQASTSRSRKMCAKTQKGSRVDEVYDSAADDAAALDENGMFNFNKWAARTPPRFEPYYGRQFVWHQNRIFWFKRSRRPNEGQRLQVSFGHAPEDDIIQLDCIGRSIEPIKNLLKTVRVWSLNRNTGTTTIRHPTPKDRARFGGTWSKTASRPSRPMDTVILDREQKEGIVGDMNEYLHPASPKWYATRGIPYRRGYLFHGPPGTGKTSLSFALAGIFGLEIYAISLQEPTLTEGDLVQLFNGLPRRCIVLLEDVDAAGLVRDVGGDEEEGKRKGRKEKGGEEKGKKEEVVGEKAKDEEFTLRDLAKELKALGGGGGRQGGRGGSGNRGSTNPDGSSNTGGISLSGLLNAIDGVATHEGRVLIMTTNHAEKLDAALVRPGRVDRKVEFGLARREQIRELFVRMYAASEEQWEGKKILLQRKEGVANGDGETSKDANGFIKPPTKSAKDHLTVSVSRPHLEELAAEFAGHVPDDTFTPAEVQNLLMRHKKDPKAAVEKVEEWVTESLREKNGDDGEGEGEGEESGKGEESEDVDVEVVEKGERD